LLGATVKGGATRPVFSVFFGDLNSNVIVEYGEAVFPVGDAKTRKIPAFELILFECFTMISIISLRRLSLIVQLLVFS